MRMILFYIWAGGAIFILYGASQGAKKLGQHISRISFFTTFTFLLFWPIILPYTFWQLRRSGGWRKRLALLKIEAQLEREMKRIREISIQATKETEKK